MALPDDKKEKIQGTIERIVRASAVRHGEYNVETYFAPNGEVFVIEINSRQAEQLYSPADGTAYRRQSD